MARPVRVTLSSAATSDPIPLDVFRNPFNVAIGVALTSGATLTYTVEYTFDDPYSSTFDPLTATWYELTDLASKTTSLDSSILTPVTAVRFTITSYTDGSATATVIQAGLRCA
jgi:hypothetical protein